MSDITAVRDMYFADVQPLLQELERRERGGPNPGEAARVAEVMERFERAIWIAAGEDPDGGGEPG